MKISPIVMRFISRYKVPLFLIGIIFLLCVGFFISPFSPTHMCTLMGCVDRLELVISQHPTQPYLVEVVTDKGETRSITCNPASDENPSPPTGLPVAACSDEGVIFYEFAPKQLTIKVTWQDGSYSVTGVPTYESFQPNGRFCPPICQAGKLQVSIP